MNSLREIDKDYGLVCDLCENVTRSFYVVGDTTIFCKHCGDKAIPAALWHLYQKLGKGIEVMYMNLDNEKDYH